MSRAKNILFIMCDQLRWDYLSCYGHPHLQTPNIDRLAARGVRFENAFVQSPLCGPSRRCAYTGRYLFSHGASINGMPLRVDERSMGDYLQELGVRTAVVGKSHVVPNRAEMERLGIEPNSPIGQSLRNGGFDPVWEDGGMHPDPITPPDLYYNQWLRQQGYDNENPWDRNANGALDEAGNFLSGWQMRNARRPANIVEAHSETAYTTTRALEFLQQQPVDQPWCLHLSYIKPHWPYMAPAPYHALYGAEEILPAQRSETERSDPHPVYAAFMADICSQNFARDEVRQTVIPTYMGLVKQIDDHLGRVWDFLEASGHIDDTLVVFTSDHGDYLGDHWLGEKYLFHDASVRVPLIICDPSPAADGTRGTTNRNLVELVDLLPTFVDALGGEIAEEQLEGRSLLPLLHGKNNHPWRECAISEIDYTDSSVRHRLGLHPYDCRATMVRTHDWLYVFHEAFRPQLFDLRNDPEQFIDQGADPAYAAIRTELHERLFAWMRQRRLRTTRKLSDLYALGPEVDERLGILIGHW